MRAPAALTVLGDSVVGAMWSGRPLGGRRLALPLASALLYWSGMVLNDWADRKRDAVERPERPIPSGDVSPAAALSAATILAGGGGRPPGPGRRGPHHAVCGGLRRGCQGHRGRAPGDVGLPVLRCHAWRRPTLSPRPDSRLGHRPTHHRDHGAIPQRGNGIRPPHAGSGRRCRCGGGDIGRCRHSRWASWIPRGAAGCGLLLGIRARVVERVAATHR